MTLKMKIATTKSDNTNERQVAQTKFRVFEAENTRLKTEIVSLKVAAKERDAFVAKQRKDVANAISDTDTLLTLSNDLSHSVITCKFYLAVYDLLDLLLSASDVETLEPGVRDNVYKLQGVRNVTGHNIRRKDSTQVIVYKVKLSMTKLKSKPFCDLFVYYPNILPLLTTLTTNYEAQHVAENELDINSKCRIARWWNSEEWKFDEL